MADMSDRCTDAEQAPDQQRVARRRRRGRRWTSSTRRPRRSIAAVASRRADGPRSPRWRRRGRRSTGRGAQMSARERGRLVRKLGERLIERADEVARLETLHNGKPISESRHIEIPAAAECFEYYGGWSDKVMGETIPVKGNYLTYTLREPIGVVAAIVPWNFPLLLAAWKVAPALACGNTVILKPASQTPLTALALGEIARRGRAAARRAQRHHRPGRQPRAGDRRASRHRQDRVHRRHQHRQRHHARRRRHAEEDHARARRQVAEHRPRRRRHRCGGARRDDRHLLRQGGGLRRRLAAAGRSVDQGRVHRQAGGAGEEDGARRSAGSQDAVRRGLVAEADGDGAALHRHPASRKGRRSSPAARAPTSAPARATSCSRRCSPTCSRR